MSTPNIPVAVGLIFDKDGCILTSQRQSHQSQTGRWEFPGGKIEPGEAPYDALVRELREEVGIEVQSAEPFMTVDHCYDTHQVTLSVYKVTGYTGTPRGVEGQNVRWVSPAGLMALDFLAGNDAILEGLQLLR